MLKKVGFGLAGLIGVMVLVIATRSSTFHIERSIDVAAPPDIVFEEVNDFHRWPGWSPWEKRDPTMKKTFTGPARGLGSGYNWSGNKEVGEGKMTITDSQPLTKVSIKLEFIKPYEGTSAATFTIKSAPPGTHVTWAMDGANDFMGKAVSMFVDMDKKIGADFEEGLASMKQVSEAQAKARLAAPPPAPAAAPPVPAAPAAPAAPAPPPPGGAPSPHK